MAPTIDEQRTLTGQPVTPPSTTAFTSADAQPLGEPEAEKAPAKTKHRILVIDDDEAIADLLVTLLEHRGYDVEVATDGEYGLMLADTFEPELILLDVVMPGLNGFEITQILRHSPKFSSRFRYTRIFYLTGHRQVVMQQRFSAATDVPVSDWVYKPFHPMELLKKIQRVFEESEAEKQAVQE